MSLSAVIKFKELDAQLTDSEFEQFLSSLSRELVSKSLFNYLKSNTDEIPNITAVQSQIIDNRESQKMMILSYDSIDTLPSELIDECGSYLGFRQYFRFAQCSRNIYVGCYSFPKIARLDLRTLPGVVRHEEVRDGRAVRHDVSLSPFINIHRLDMEIGLFNALSQSNRAILNDNTSLTHIRLELEERERCSQDSLALFSQNVRSLNCYNLRNLEIVAVNDYMCAEPFSNLLSMFGNYSNIKYLTIDETPMTVPFDSFGVPFDPNRLQSWFPNVTHLTLVNTVPVFSSNIIRALHNQLEVLHVYSEGTRSDPMLLSDVKFPQLQSLDLYCENLNIFEGTKQLKTVSVITKSADIANDCIDHTIKQKTLENITITLSNRDRPNDIDPFSVVMQKMEAALMSLNNENMTREALHIQLSFDKKNIISEKPIFGIINALRTLNMNEWCLCVDTYAGSTLTVIDKDYLEGQLNQLKQKYFVYYQNNELQGFKIVVTNTKAIMKRHLLIY